ncbi:MAG: YigZ family protein [Streptococcaceae bacterium]|nr:YigZ family protein [Streptococcaceae bacterium]
MSDQKRLPTFYFTIFQDGSHEIEIKKSRFFCHLKRVFTENEARNFIAKIKKEHFKARHNCSAFIVSNNSEIKRSSDDGEPSGTAGMPILEVLKNKQLINVCAVVTRYFGGVKLGIGRLIRAYTQSVAETLQKIGIVKKVLQQEIRLKIDYALNGKLQSFFTLHPEYTVKESFFMEQIEVIVFVAKEAVISFQEEVTNLLNGKVDFALGEFTYNEILI